MTKKEPFLLARVPGFLQVRKAATKKTEPFQSVCVLRSRFNNEEWLLFGYAHTSLLFLKYFIDQ
tara:strand:- start:58 stop:249 length:192 start_codon:yes stop_codon:yes gene_type:complete